jgi:phosphoenolpyruvate carboxykinase (ATP)
MSTKFITTPPASSLYEHAIRFEGDVSIAETGALVAYSDTKTGRSPKDKRLVKHPESEGDVWWGPVNIPCDGRTFAIKPSEGTRLPEHSRTALLFRRLCWLGS